MRKLLAFAIVVLGLAACQPTTPSLIAATVDSTSTSTTATTQPPPPPPPPPSPPPGSITACSQVEEYRRKMAPIPCSEVDRAVSEAAVEFRIDEYKFRRVINCESHFVPTAGSFYRGLTQQSQEFFNRWLPRFNAAVEPNLGAGRAYPSRDHPWDNARLAAYVIDWYDDQGKDPYQEWGICA